MSVKFYVKVWLCKIPGCLSKEKKSWIKKSLFDYTQYVKNRVEI